MLSATVINMNPSVNERHISFAIKKENDLNENNHTTIAINDNDVTDDGSSTALGIYERLNKRQLYILCLFNVDRNKQIRKYR